MYLRGNLIGADNGRRTMDDGQRTTDDGRGSSLAAARCSDSCSCTAWFVRALHCHTFSNDCSKLLTTGLAHLSL